VLLGLLGLLRCRADASSLLRTIRALAAPLHHPAPRTHPPTHPPTHHHPLRRRRRHPQEYKVQVMGPSAALPAADAACRLSNTAGDAFWAEFWAIHEQLIDFAAIAAAHEEFFRPADSPATPQQQQGQGQRGKGPLAAPAPAAAPKRSEDEEAAAWAEIIIACDRPAGAPAPAPAPAPAALAAKGGAAGAAQPGRAILMGSKQPGALPPAAAGAAAGAGRAILMGTKQPGAMQPPPDASGLAGLSLGPSAGADAAGGWQLGAYWPGVLGRRVSASELDEAVAEAEAEAEAEAAVSCASSISVHLAGASYAEQLKQAAAAAAAGLSAWSRQQQRPASQSERLLGARPAQPLPVLGHISSRELLPPGRQ
jgi:hypothetical protein